MEYIGFEIQTGGGPALSQQPHHFDRIDCAIAADIADLPKRLLLRSATHVNEPKRIRMGRRLLGIMYQASEVFSIGPKVESKIRLLARPVMGCNKTMLEVFHSSGFTVMLGQLRGLIVHPWIFIVWQLLCLLSTISIQKADRLLILI